MARLDSNRRRAASRLLLALAIGAAILGAILEATGGFSIHPYGVRISAHGALRPLLVALLLAASSFRLAGAAAQQAAVARGIRLADRLLPFVAPAAAAVVLAI